MIVKYRDRRNNYYDTKIFKNTVVAKSSTNIATFVISKKIIEQANKHLNVYKICGHSRYVLLGLLLISPYLLIFPIITTLLCLYMKNYSTVNLSYKMNTLQKNAFAQQLSSVKKIMASQKISWVKSQSKVFESRYEAGAGKVWDTVPCKIVSQPPFPFSTNLRVLSIQTKQQSVTFFPDKIIIISNDHIVDVPYDGIHYEYEDFNFIENDWVPKDTTVVGSTWRYVNNDGSPDRRFKNNKRLPICGYGKLKITSKTGLNICLIFSNRSLWISA